MRYTDKLFLLSLILICGPWLGDALAEQRTWRDQSGNFSVEAELVKVDDQQVTLRTKDNKQVTVALAKLCEEDRMYLEELSAQKDAERGIRLTVTRFFNALRKGEETRDEEIRETITVKSRDKLEGSGSEINNLAKPDRSTKPAIRNISIDGDTAEATVRMRLRGKSILPRVLLRREDDTWLVYGLVGPNQEEEETTILFEDTDGNSNAREINRDGDEGGSEAMEREVEVARTEQPHPEEKARAAANNSDPFAIPEGDARVLMEFLDQLLVTQPPAGTDEAAHTRKVAGIIETTANRVLADHAATTADKTKAANRLVEALLVLFGAEPEAYLQKLTELPEELARRELEEPSQKAQSAVLLVNLTAVAMGDDTAAAQQAVDEALAHLKTAPLNEIGLQLAGAITQLSDKVGASFAAKTYAATAEILSGSEQEMAQEMAPAMLARSRRLGLIGNTMVVKGVSVKGEPFNFADNDGKVVLVNFWATFSDPSREELRGIKAYYDKYHQHGLEVVAISVDNHIEALYGYLNKEKPPWTVLADYHGKNEEPVSEYYGIETLPQTILIGANGKVMAVESRSDKLAEHLQQIFGDEA